MLSLLSTTAAWAQFGAPSGDASPGTVSGTGMVSVKQRPTLFRMTIKLQ